MTLEELNESFLEKQGAIVGYLVKKGVDKSEAEDLAHDVYIKALEGIEYLGVSYKYAYSWWIYKVRAHRQKSIVKKRNEEDVEALYHLLQDDYCDMELTPEQAMRVVEGYWSGLSRVQQHRIRKAWLTAGKVLPSFMGKKIGV